MWKVIGIILLLAGTAGVLQTWITAQRYSQTQLETFKVFLQKSLYVMQAEKIKVVDYFERYIVQLEQKDDALIHILEEIVNRLSLNTYPSGLMIWEDVFKENEKTWNFDAEMFQIIVQAGNGFFGRTKEENIKFLEKYIKELEKQQERIKQKNEQERKVWIPVGMLGTLMLVILFI